MFTVILLSDSARSIYESARVYFAPFEEAGLIAFCDWDQSPQARTLQEAVPSLPDIIRGKAHWRAVVVDHPRSAVGVSSSEARDGENPFDFVDNRIPTLNLEDSKHPLIRLSHVLLGYPQMSAKVFEPYLQYEDRETGRLVEGSAQQLLSEFARGPECTVAIDLDGERSEEEWFRLATTTIGQVHNRVRRLFREVEYSTEEKATYNELVERYRMKEVRPSEVLFVATRPDIEEDEKSILKRAWHTDTEQNSSRFVERNDYPPMSRFAAYELLEEENSGYEQDLLRFWLSVLSLAINQLPRGSFQAERLYQLGVEFGTEGLAEMLNAHLSKLATVRDHLDWLIRTPPRPPEMSVDDLLEPVETHIVFDDLGGAELEAGTSGYGLASDRPREEHQRWAEEVSRSSAEAALFLRKPRRAVARAVHGARELVHIDEEQVTLNEIERDELDEELSRRLRELVVPTTTDLLDKGRLQRAIDKGDLRVRTFIAQRMRARTILLAAVIALGVWFAAFVPYLLQAGARGVAEVVDGILLVVLVLAVVAGAGLLTLVALRIRLRRRIGWFNVGVRAEVAAVRKAASRFAEFLSGFVTFRKGALRLRGANRARDLTAARLRRLRRLRAFIVDKIGEEKEIVLSLGAPLAVQRTAAGLVGFDPDDPASIRTLFRFPIGESRIPFNDSGEDVDAPYDFVTHLTLHRLPLFERSEAAVETSEARG